MGEEDVTTTGVPEEHRRIITTVHTQAEDHAKSQYKEMQAEVLVEQQGQHSECGTASSIAEAAAATLGTLRGLPGQATLPDEDEDGASTERTAVHISRHENDVAYVTKNRKQIMDLRTVPKWERSSE